MGGSASYEHQANDIAEYKHNRCGTTIPDGVTGTPNPVKTTFKERWNQGSEVNQALGQLAGYVKGFSPGDGYHAAAKRNRDFDRFRQEIYTGNCRISEVQKFIEVYSNSFLCEKKIREMINKHCLNE